MRLTRDQLAAYAAAVGFPYRTIPVVVAIALAESSGETTAHNPLTPDDSYGLWQINMIGDLEAERIDQFGIDKKEDLYDPLTNARAAFIVSHCGRSFRPWSTYLNGTYKAFLP